MSLAKGFEKTAGVKFEQLKKHLSSNPVSSFLQKRRLTSLADKQMDLAFKSKPGFITGHMDRAEDYLKASKGGK